MIRKKTAGTLAFDIILVFLMSVIAVLMIYPFLYILFYSVSDVSKLKFPILIFPVGFNLDSYEAILRIRTIFQAALVSVARCVLGPLGMLIVSGMAGYVLTRQDLVFKNAIRVYLVFSMYVSAGLIPGYLNIKNLGLTNSFWVYVIPGLANIGNMILIRAFISNMPKELVESVKIDGGSDLTAYMRIILPLSLPINAAVVLFAIIGGWNAYFDVALYNGSRPELYTLSFVLYVQLTSVTNISLEKLKEMALLGQTIKLNNQSLTMALTVILITPMMCLYPFMQKYFASGLLIGSIKL